MYYPTLAPKPTTQMRWTKPHSKNAVAAKARLRLQGVSQKIPPRKVKVFSPRGKPDFIIRIESRFGERLQVSIHRTFGSVKTSDGQSARQFCRGLEQLLTKSA